MDWLSLLHTDPKFSNSSPYKLESYSLLVFFKQFVNIWLTNLSNLIHLPHVCIVLQRPNNIFFPICCSYLRTYESHKLVNVIKTRIQFLNFVRINLTKSELINWTLIFFQLIMLIKLAGCWTYNGIFAN